MSEHVERIAGIDTCGCCETWVVFCRLKTNEFTVQAAMCRASDSVLLLWVASLEDSVWARSPKWPRSQ